MTKRQTANKQKQQKSEILESKVKPVQRIRTTQLK